MIWRESRFLTAEDYLIWTVTFVIKYFSLTSNLFCICREEHAEIVDVGKASTDSVKFTPRKWMSNVTTMTETTLTGHIRGGDKGGGDSVIVKNFGIISVVIVMWLFSISVLCGHF